MNRFMRAVRGESQTVPPIWLMRQAGRYHRHYQAIRRTHSFEAMCRTPDIAAEIALGPVRDFDFDAAILFSDLLFPLEALGFGLTYDNGPPELDGPLTEKRIARFRSLDTALARLHFQGEAVAATRALLPADKGLIGFVGGPWTLFVYGVEGSHAGPLTKSKSSAAMYRAFAKHMVPLVKRQVRMQLDAGADVVMVLDTAAGDVPYSEFSALVAGDIAALARAFPHKLGYYAKGSHPSQLSCAAFRDAPWAGVGVDGRWNLADTLARRPLPGFVQGNFDPALLHLTGRALTTAIRRFLEPVRVLPERARRGWICGVGHGVLPETPEDSVRTFVRLTREVLS